VVLHDYALYKSTFTLLYFTTVVMETTQLVRSQFKHLSPSRVKSSSL